MSSDSVRSPETVLPGGVRPQLLQAIALVLGAFWAFGPVLHGQWLWDDDFFFTKSPLNRDPTALGDIWLLPGNGGDYMPITTTIMRLEWLLFGEHTFGYHLVNLILHLVSSFLVWRLLEKFGLRLAWCGGLLFAIHPLMVETVGWMSELKNTLALPPLLLSMCFWMDYDNDRSLRHYRLAFWFFVVAMFCKSTAIMYPLVLFLFAWWQRGRIGLGELKACGPFLLVSLASGLLSSGLEHGRARPQEVLHADLLLRVETVIEQVFFMLQRAVVPIHLLPVYPSGLVVHPGVMEFFLWALVILALVVAWRRRRTWGRHIWLGFGFFLINLLPVLIYMFSTTTKMVWSMDHLEYISIVGVIGLMVAGLECLDGALSAGFRPLLYVGAALVAVMLAQGSHAYSAIFAKAQGLWSYALEHNPGNYMVHYNLAEAYAGERRYTDAVAEMRIATQLHPYYDSEHCELADWLAAAGMRDEAVREYKTVIRLNPGNADAYFDLAGLYVQMNRLHDASNLYLKIIQLEPTLSVHDALGNLYAAQNRIPEAIVEYQKSIAQEPKNGDVHAALGDLYFRTGRFSEAAAEFELAIPLIPGSEKARTDYGITLARLGRLPEALEQFSAAVQINPNSAGAHNNFGNALLSSGRVADAMTEYEMALQIQPGMAQAQQSLDRARQLQNAPPAAPASPSP